MDPQTERSLLETGQNDCQKPRSQMDKAHCKVDIDQAERVPKARETSHNMGRRHQHAQQTKVCGENTNLTPDMTWLATAQGGLKWDSMESDVVNSRHPTTTNNTPTPTESSTTEQTTYTAIKQNERDAMKTTSEANHDDDGDTLLLFSQIIENKQTLLSTLSTARQTQQNQHNSAPALL